MRRTPYGDQIPAALLLSRLPTSCLPFPARDLADISFAVIHERAKRRRTARRSKLVNNCAASHNDDGGRLALARSRSWLAHPRRVKLRLPAGLDLAHIGAKIRRSK